MLAEIPLVVTRTYRPSRLIVDEIDVLPTKANLQGETMLYQASTEFAYEHGGPITKEFIDKLPSGKPYIVDVRVHHLTEGQYPCIPGYHLDWIPRINKGAAPNLMAIPDYNHVIMILAESSLTEYVDEPISITHIQGDTFEHANEKIKRAKAKTWNVSNGQMVQFTSYDWHRGVPAQGNEWRFLIRASQATHVRPSNEIRTQAQVYVPIQESSW